jgi:glycine/D-amino acid oxidase-like deaminating enzyme
MSTSGPYDVIVVGAGLAGALIASTLAAEGLQVVVLEAAESVGGTIRRQPGLALLGTPVPFTELIAQQGEDPAHTLWELTSDNLVRLEILLDQNNVASQKSGSLRLSADHEESQAFRASVQQLKTYGFGVDLEDDDGHGELVAIGTHDDIVFRPQDLISRLLDHENIIVELKTEVHTTKRRADGSIAIWAHQSYLWADKVVFANGMHAARLNTQMSQYLSPMCMHTIVFENVKTLDRPLILDSGKMCFLPSEDCAYLTGWSREEQDSLHRLGIVAEQLCPNALVRERFTTWIASSNDHFPVVGQLQEEPNVFLVNGLGPFGLNLALIAMDELASLILEGQTPELFGLERFSSI